MTKLKTLEQLRTEKERAETLGSEVILTPEDGYSYEFYSDKAYVKRIVVENTVDFFEDKLKNMRERFAYCDIELKNIRQSHINQRRNSMVLKSNFSSALRFYGFLSYKGLKIDIINAYENDKNIMHYRITISRMWKAHSTTTI